MFYRPPYYEVSPSGLLATEQQRRFYNVRYLYLQLGARRLRKTGIKNGGNVFLKFWSTYCVTVYVATH
jgi:hypothetical protein